MIRSLQRPAWRDWIVVVSTVGYFATFPLAAETVTNGSTPHRLFSAPARLSPPPMAHAKSPVDLFRELLAMTPEDREKYLANRPPEIGARILAKVAEYEALDPNERELRLRATELRWYLLPLMHQSPTNRAAQLAAVPDDIRDLVQDRISQWDILPPTLQQEFLEDESVLKYFERVKPIGGPPGADAGNVPGFLYPDAQSRKIAEHINSFFELTEEEKQATLNTLSEAERQQIKNTLRAFDQLPVSQRTECVQAFAKFAGLSPAEQQQFLKNADRWAQMSPADRQTWRDLVTHVPDWPPLPPGFFPPRPPVAAVHSTVATNHD
ncbi:MAG: DUF3106 domain-containing protein [Verrucomicrobiia bacterium]